MASVTVRISAKSRQALRELALQTGDSMQSVLEKAIDVNVRRGYATSAQFFNETLLAP